jgi:hypothetical protein
MNKYLFYFFSFITIITILNIYTTNTENFSSEEAVENVASLYNKDKMIINNLTTSKKLTSNGETDFKSLNSKVVSTNKITADKLCIGDTCINSEAELKKLKSLKSVGGYVLDGQGSTHLLIEGEHEGHHKHMEHNDYYYSWAGDRWDIAYIFRGWKVTFYHHFLGDNNKNEKQEVSNTESWKPKRVNLDNFGMGDAVNAVKVEWIGY